MADPPPTKPKPVLADLSPPEQLTDGELTLRRWRARDAPALLAAAAASLPELRRWMPWAARGYAIDDAAGFLRVAVADWDAGRAYNFAVVVDGRVLGSFGLSEPAAGGVGVGMGYWLATEATGRGLATRAAGLLTTTAFACGAELVQIWHRVENARSRAIPERLGYRFLGEREDLHISEHGVMGLWQKDSPKAQG